MPYAPCISRHIKSRFKLLVGWCVVLIFGWFMFESDMCDSVVESDCATEKNIKLERCVNLVYCVKYIHAFRIGFWF